MKWIIALVILFTAIALCRYNTKVDGVIEFKTKYTMYGDSVFFFYIKGRKLEVGRGTFYKYETGSYYKQGLLE